MSAPPLFVGSPGLVCPVGLDADAACAAMRAELAAFEVLPYVTDDAQPIIGAPVPGLPFSLTISERLVSLFERLLRSWIGRRAPDHFDRIPILVGVDESAAQALRRPNSSLISLVEERIGTRFHPGLSRIFAGGHTAGFLALDAARAILRAGEASACLVCGVGSCLNAPCLSWLSETMRLKTVDNSDGLIPGEAAACVLVRARAPASAGPGAIVRGIGFGSEPVTVLSDEPFHGLGLAAAARAALAEAGLGLHEIDLRLSDVTGERYGFKEQLLMVSRLMRERRETFPIWHPAEFIGDTGAAAGVVELVIACQSFWKGYAPGARAMGFTSAVNGARAAVVLERPRDVRQSLPRDDRQFLLGDIPESSPDGGATKD